MAKLAGPGKGCGCVSPQQGDVPTQVPQEMLEGALSLGLSFGGASGLASHPVSGTCPAQGAWANGSWLRVARAFQPQVAGCSSWQEARASPGV